MDAARAKDGPFGGTIAHGYLTLSLAPVLLGEVLVVQGASMGVNYGCNKVRFPAPVPVDSNLRLGATVATVEDVTGGVQVALALTFETEGRPSRVAWPRWSTATSTDRVYRPWLARCPGPGAASRSGRSNSTSNHS